MTAAVIADIVGSRRMPDRASAQRTLDAAIARVEAEFSVAVRPLRPTVGDEQQGVFPSLESALASLLLLQLALPEGVACRFGIGIGAVTVIESAAGDISDGPGWWAARAAIDRAHALQDRLVPRARTIVVAGEEEHALMASHLAVVNAYLLARDELVGAMSARARRLVYGRCLGVTQRELAEAEGITQSAVSQALAAARAPGLIAGFAALTGGAA